MISIEELQKIKRLTISALVSDEILMGLLVLKGGNALDIAYDISNRGSIDIDFSMERDFTAKEKQRIQNQCASLLNAEFNREDLIAFDVKMKEKPQKIDKRVADFWGGYLLEFKIIEKDKFDSLVHDLAAVRRNAIALHKDNSTKFTVDISKYEYISNNKRPKDIEGATVYVYTPEMLVFEKLRALCQQNPDYKKVIHSITGKSRARDFYDIYNLYNVFLVNFSLNENIELCKHIFDAKHVPFEYIQKLDTQKEFHGLSWSSVVDTVNDKKSLKDFDFYFDFVLDKVRNMF